MKLINQTDKNKLLMAVLSSILKEENKTAILSPDDEKSREAKAETEKLLQQALSVGVEALTEDNKIIFTNGSTIEFIIPGNKSEVIRGKRSSLPMCLYDYETCDKEVVDEVLKPFMRLQ